MEDPPVVAEVDDPPGRPEDDPEATVEDGGAPRSPGEADAPPETFDDDHPGTTERAYAKPREDMSRPGAVGPAGDVMEGRSVWYVKALPRALWEGGAAGWGVGGSLRGTRLNSWRCSAHDGFDHHHPQCRECLSEGRQVAVVYVVDDVVHGLVREGQEVGGRGAPRPEE